MKKLLWEILIPAFSNSFDEFSVEYHQEWDHYVQSLAEGLTIFKKSKGIWIGPDNVQFKEEMIPVRISCSKTQIESIANFTAAHYQQKAVMFYLISTEVYIVHYNKKLKSG
jgi:hypothetical protein